MVTVKCSSEFRTDSGEQLTASPEFAAFIRDLPSDAVLSPVMIEKGSQRDPWPVLVGLRAAWEEER